MTSGACGHVVAPGTQGEEHRGNATARRRAPRCRGPGRATSVRRARADLGGASDDTGIGDRARPRGRATRLADLVRAPRHGGRRPGIGSGRPVRARAHRRTECGPTPRPRRRRYAALRSTRRRSTTSRASRRTTVSAQALEHRRRPGVAVEDARHRRRATVDPHLDALGGVGRGRLRADRRRTTTAPTPRPRRRATTASTRVERATRANHDDGRRAAPTDGAPAGEAGGHEDDGPKPSSPSGRHGRRSGPHRRSSRRERRSGDGAGVDPASPISGCSHAGDQAGGHAPCHQRPGRRCGQEVGRQGDASGRPPKAGTSRGAPRRSAHRR